MLIDVLRDAHTAARQAVQVTCGWSVDCEQACQFETEEYGFPLMAAVHYQAGAIRRVVVGCQESLAAHVVQRIYPVASGDQAGPPSRQELRDGFGLILRQLQQALSGIWREQPVLAPFFLYEPGQFRIRASGPRNFRLDLPTPAGPLCLFIDMAVAHDLHRKIELSTPAPAQRAPAGRAFPQDQEIRDQEVIGEVLDQIARQEQDVQIKLADRDDRLRIYHATVLGPAALQAQGGVLLSSSCLQNAGLRLAPGDRAGVVFTDGEQLWQFFSEVQEVVPVSLGGAAQLPLLRLRTPQRLSPGQRRRAERVAPAEPLQGWVRCLEAGPHAGAGDNEYSVPVLVKDVSFTGATLTMSDDAVISSFKWGTRITCQLQLPDPFKSVEFQGIVQRLTILPKQGLANIVHLGIEFIEAGRKPRAGLPTLHEYIRQQLTHEEMLV